MSIFSGNYFRVFVMPLLLAWLAGCAATTSRSPASQVSAEPVSVPVVVAESETVEEGLVATQSLTKDILFNILIGEISGQRNRMDVAVPHYLDAAEAANDPRVAERAVRMAMYAKDFQGAMQATRRWLMLEPESTDAHKTMTGLALKLGDDEEVITQLDYLVSDASSSVAGFSMASSVLTTNEDKAHALVLMEKLVARHSENPHAQVALARIALRADQLEQAGHAADAALQLEPGLPRAVILKAQISLQQEQQQVALDILKRGVEAEPEHDGMRLAYARVLLDSEMLAEAKVQYYEVIRLTPDNTDVVYALALLELDEANWNSAIELLDLVLAAGTRLDAARYYMGIAKSSQGNDTEALEWYRQVDWGEFWSAARLNEAVIHLNRGKPDVVRARMQKLRLQYPEEAQRIFLIEGQAFSSVGQDEAAYDTYTEALMETPDDEEFLYLRGLAAGDIGRIDQAEKDMRHILRNDPNNIRALNALGYTLADRTDRYDEALGFIMQAYAKKPDDPAIIDSLGWVNYRMGNFDEAVRYLRQAWDLTINGEIGAHLGEVLWIQGERESARDVWEKSKENSPDDPVLQEVMDRFMP